MISTELLELVRCPICVHKEGKTGELKLHRDSWLVCDETDCNRKYPIRQDIPILLPEAGEKWANTEVQALPVPPPDED